MKVLLKNKELNRYMLLCPGWTFDYKIFPDFNYNIIYYDYLDTENFITAIKKFLQENEIKNIYLLGWSMGGLVVSKLIEYLNVKIEKIFLISVVKNFNGEMLKKTEALLNSNFSKAIDKFYRNIFIGDSALYSFFKKNYYEYYINRANQKLVYYELEFLKNNYIDTKKLSEYNVTVIGSKNDIVTPYSEVKKFANEILNSKFIYSEFTHLPFLYREIYNEINKG